MQLSTLQHLRVGPTTLTFRGQKNPSCTIVTRENPRQLDEVPPDLQDSDGGTLVQIFLSLETAEAPYEHNADLHSETALTTTALELAMQIRLWMMPTFSTPGSLQANSQFYWLCEDLHIRKNWLLSHSVEDAEGSTALYSLIETARANSLNTYACLKHLFTMLPNCCTAFELQESLPWHVDREPPAQYTQRQRAEPCSTLPITDKASIAERLPLIYPLSKQIRWGSRRDLWQSKVNRMPVRNGGTLPIELIPLGP